MIYFLFLFPPLCSSFTGIYIFLQRKRHEHSTVYCCTIYGSTSPPFNLHACLLSCSSTDVKPPRAFWKGGKRKETPSVQKKVNSTWRGRRGGNTLQRTVASSNLSCLQCKKEKIRARSMHTKVCATQQRARSVFYVYLTEERVLILLVRR